MHHTFFAMALVGLMQLVGAVSEAADQSITSLPSVDLTKIERKIVKLPELKSSQPLYCLLVFGYDANTRIWLVRDDDILYVDRNGNGDLTGDRVYASAKPLFTSRAGAK